MSTQSKSLTATLPRIGSIQARILKYLQEAEIYKSPLWRVSTRRKIQDGLNLLPSSVTARLHELVTAGAVAVCDTAYDPVTDRHVSVYKLTDKGFKWASTLT